MIRFILLASVLALLAVPLMGCQSDCGMSLPTPPALTARWPVLLDPEPPTRAAPRMLVVPGRTQYFDQSAVGAPGCTPAGAAPAASPQPLPPLPPGYRYR